MLSLPLLYYEMDNSQVDILSWTHEKTEDKGQPNNPKSWETLWRTVIIAHLMQKPPDVGKENSSRVAGKLGEAEHKLVGQCGVCGGHRYSSMCASSCQTFLHKFHQTLNREDWGEKNMITARGEQNPSVLFYLSWHYQTLLHVGHW